MSDFSHEPERISRLEAWSLALATALVALVVEKNLLLVASCGELAALVAVGHGDREPHGGCRGRGAATVRHRSGRMSADSDGACGDRPIGDADAR